MKRVLTIAALAAAVSLFLVSGAFAGTQDGSVIALHAKATTTKNSCTTWAPTIPCSQYTKAYGQDVDLFVYLVVARAPDAIKGIAGMSCGILYAPTTYMYGFSLCADLQFTNGPGGPETEWPVSGGGNRITWVSTTNCQRTVRAPDGVHAIGGYFKIYAYAPDNFAVTGNMNLGIPELAVADCNAATTMLPMDGSVSGVIGLGGLPGYNPCTDQVPVQETTWGRVKSQY